MKLGTMGDRAITQQTSKEAGDRAGKARALTDGNTMASHTTGVKWNPFKHQHTRREVQQNSLMGKALKPVWRISTPECLDTNARCMENK